jgi:hypothetical protein
MMAWQRRIYGGIDGALLHMTPDRVHDYCVKLKG